MYQKTLDFGKIDYNRSGRRNCRVTVKVNISEPRGKPVLSIQGNVWNPRGTDIYCGGQCYDSLSVFFPGNARMARIIEVWRRWHLNDMQAGCVHQRAEKWEDRRISVSDLPKSQANRDERGIIATWIHKSEHPQGLLNEPCPTCGYKYGSEWLHEDLPQSIIDEVKSW